MSQTRWIDARESRRLSLVDLKAHLMSHNLDTNSMTVEQFEEKMMEGERWIEVDRGRFIQLNPPDEVHGDVVRNLSRALATFLQRSENTYACFELPLILQANPATIRCPAISCFRFEGTGRFAEMDKLMTDHRPSLIIEVASSNERRDAASARLQSYLDWGVPDIWVIDPTTRHVHQFHGEPNGQMIKEPQVLLGQFALRGVAMPISDLFRQRKWARHTGPVENGQSSS